MTRFYAVSIIYDKNLIEPRGDAKQRLILILSEVHDLIWCAVWDLHEQIFHTHLRELLHPDRAFWVIGCG